MREDSVHMSDLRMGSLDDAKVRCSGLRTFSLMLGVYARLVGLGARFIVLGALSDARLAPFRRRPVSRAKVAPRSGAFVYFRPPASRLDRDDAPRSPTVGRGGAGVARARARPAPTPS